MNSPNVANVKLELLVGLFYDTPNQLGSFTEIPAENVPQPANQLLAHDRHMTVTVEQFHGCPVDVKVLQTRIEGDHYSRKILLTRQSDDSVVMFGIVRLDLSVLSPNVRTEIESQQTPLGRILIKHDVLRSVKLLKLFRIDAGDELADSLDINAESTCFGRTALIYCDGAPAIELLEIVGCG